MHMLRNDIFGYNLTRATPEQHFAAFLFEKADTLDTNLPPPLPLATKSLQIWYHVRDDGQNP